MKIVLVSDTHGLHDRINIPDGDILIHAGDITNYGMEEEVRDFDRFLSKLPHKHKIFIAGNHDLIFEYNPTRAAGLVKNGIYLQDSMVVVEGIRIYGTPWNPAYLDVGAFFLPRGGKLAEKWAMIPNDIDILITHCPPFGVRDLTLAGESAGCSELSKRVCEIRPKMHVFGHMHASYGVHEENGIKYLNVSLLNDKDEKFHAPLIVDIN